MSAPEAYLEDGELTASGWSRALRDGVFLGQRCPTGHVTAAPKAACVRCGERELTPERLPTEGEVFSETTIEVAPTGFDASYVVALIDLGEARVLGRASESVEIGDDVSIAGSVGDGGTAAPVFEPR